MRIFRTNPHLAAELARMAEVRAATRAAAEQVAAAARRLAPDSGPGRGYRETIAVRDDGDDVQVVTTDFAGHIIEFGSVNNPPYAPLRRGVRAAGLRLTDER